MILPVLLMQLELLDHISERRILKKKMNPTYFDYADSKIGGRSHLVMKANDQHWLILFEMCGKENDKFSSDNYWYCCTGTLWSVSFFPLDGESIILI